MSGMYFMKGVGVGMVAGAAVAVLAMPKKKKPQTAYKKAIKTVGDIIDDITH